jgi:hypothetical protein
MIVGLIGGSNCGKTKTANFMMKHGGFVMFGFTDPLRKFLFQLMPEYQEQIFGSSRHREEMLPAGVTVRSMMDELGSIVRKAKPTALVDFAMGAAACTLDAHICSGIVFHDTRKWIEVAAIRGMGGRIVRLTRGSEKSTLDGELANCPADYTIDNRTMTLEDLEAHTIEMMGALRRAGPEGDEKDGSGV